MVMLCAFIFNVPLNGLSNLLYKVLTAASLLQVLHLKRIVLWHYQFKKIVFKVHNKFSNEIQKFNRNWQIMDTMPTIHLYLQLEI